MLTLESRARRGVAIESRLTAERHNKYRRLVAGEEIEKRGCAVDEGAKRRREKTEIVVPSARGSFIVAGSASATAPRRLRRHHANPTH